jgi:hypothetical protein
MVWHDDIPGQTLQLNRVSQRRQSGDLYKISFGFLLICLPMIPGGYKDSSLLAQQFTIGGTGFSLFLRAYRRVLGVDFPVSTAILLVLFFTVFHTSLGRYSIAAVKSLAPRV